MKITLSFLFAIAILGTGNLAAISKRNAAGAPADPGWPRERTNEQGRLIYYQPQVDAWTNFKQLDFRMFFFPDAERWERDHRHPRSAGADECECRRSQRCDQQF